MPNVRSVTGSVMPIKPHFMPVVMPHVMLDIRTVMAIVPHVMPVVPVVLPDVMPDVRPAMHIMHDGMSIVMPIMPIVWLWWLTGNAISIHRSRRVVHVVAISFRLWMDISNKKVYNTTYKSLQKTPEYIKRLRVESFFVRTDQDCHVWCKF